MPQPTLNGSQLTFRDEIWHEFVPEFRAAALICEIGNFFLEKAPNYFADKRPKGNIRPQREDRALTCEINLRNR